MPVSHWSRRTFTGMLGLGAAFAGGLIRPEQAAAQINRSGAGGLAPPSNGSFLVPIIRKLELDKKNGLDFDINLYSDPSTLYSDLAAGRTSHIFGAIYNCANFYVRGVPLKLLFTISTARGGFVILMEDVVIHPQHRGQGYGSMLLRYVIDFAKQKQFKRITLLTDRISAESQTFFQKNGFDYSNMIPMRRIID